MMRGTAMRETAMRDFPHPSSIGASNTMRANRGKNTKPELRVRRALIDAGLRGYRLHWVVRADDGGIAARPDIAWPRRKIAIFVNGCFWHRCPHCMPVLPKKNRAFWEEKIERNIARDRINLRNLEFLGWTVITIWECQTKSEKMLKESINLTTIFFSRD